MAMSSGNVGKLTFPDEHFDLPPLPIVLEKLLQALDSGESDAKQIAEILSVDVALVAQVMKIVNSAYYGLPTRIGSVTHAVAYLGLGQIKRLVFTVSVMERLAPSESEDFERFWYHSFHTALGAKALAKRFARSISIDPEDLDVSALLHDVGKLVYLKFFPEHYRELSRHCDAEATMMVDAEKRLGFPSHRSFGARLCDSWRLPALVKQACLAHELQDLKRCNEGLEILGDDLRIIAVANLLGNLATVELAGELKTEIRAEVSKALQCDDEAFLLLMGEIYELRPAVERFLNEL